MLKLLTAKDLAKEIPIGEHKLRLLARTFKNFPCIRNGSSTYFIKEQVEEWLEKQMSTGLRI